MTRPDDIPQRVWNEACDARAMGGGGSVVEVIARAILSAEQREREACAALMIELAETEGDPADTEWAYRKGASTISNRGTDND